MTRRCIVPGCARPATQAHPDRGEVEFCSQHMAQMMAFEADAGDSLSSRDAKPVFASRTIWLHLVAGAVTVATTMGLDLGLSEADQLAIVSAIQVFVGIVLRIHTRQAVK